MRPHGQEARQSGLRTGVFRAFSGPSRLAGETRGRGAEQPDPAVLLVVLTQEAGVQGPVGGMHF